MPRDPCWESRDRRWVYTYCASSTSPCGAETVVPWPPIPCAELPSLWHCPWLVETNADRRYFTEGAFDPIAVIAGLIQTAIYADFGYIVSRRLTPTRDTADAQYVTKVLRGQKFELPA